MFDTCHGFFVSIHLIGLLGDILITSVVSHMQMYLPVLHIIAILNMLTSVGFSC